MSAGWKHQRFRPVLCKPCWEDLYVYLMAFYNQLTQQKHQAISPRCVFRSLSPIEISEMPVAVVLWDNLIDDCGENGWNCQYLNMGKSICNIKNVTHAYLIPAGQEVSDGSLMQTPVPRLIWLLWLLPTPHGHDSAHEAISQQCQPSLMKTTCSWKGDQQRSTLPFEWSNR